MSQKTWAKRDAARKKYNDEHKIRLFFSKILEFIVWGLIGYLILLVLNVISGLNSLFVFF